MPVIRPSLLMFCWKFTDIPLLQGGKPMSQKGIFRITGRMADGDIKGKNGTPFHHEGFLQPLMEKSACVIGHTAF